MNKMDMSLLLFSDDVQIKLGLDNLRQNTKIYNRLIESLQVLGNFPPYIKVEKYKHVLDKNGSETIKGAIFDNDGNMYIIILKSPSKFDSYIINQVSNEQEKIYNTLIIKNTNITKENIELCRIDEQYNFKHGRLTTDKKTFINISVGNDIMYRIEGNFQSEEFNIDFILKQLNSLEAKPKIINLIKIFEKLISTYPEVYSLNKIAEYVNYEQKGCLELQDDQLEIENKRLVRTKENN